jgi:hypothetical protein
MLLENPTARKYLNGIDLNGFTLSPFDQRPAAGICHRGGGHFPNAAGFFTKVGPIFVHQLMIINGLVLIPPPLLVDYSPIQFIDLLPFAIRI